VYQNGFALTGIKPNFALNGGSMTRKPLALRIILLFLLVLAGVGCKRAADERMRQECLALPLFFVLELSLERWMTLPPINRKNSAYALEHSGSRVVQTSIRDDLRLGNTSDVTLTGLARVRNR
jgi:hypothetical protein